MNQPKISIVIPVIRPAGFARCRAAIAGSGLAPEQYEIVAAEDADRIGCPAMVKRLVARSRYDLVCFLGDDTIPQPGFMAEALQAMQTLPDGWGLVGLNDETGRDLPTHWLADKRLLPLLENEFFHTGYQHCFCDNELMDRCRELGRYAFADKAIVKHDHAILQGRAIEDPDLQRVYSKQTYLQDQYLYGRRKIERAVKPHIGIGFPAVDDRVPLQFMASYITIQKPAYTFLMPRRSHGDFINNIAMARNQIAEQAVREGCTHLIMMDTDQVYPPDTIHKLLAHGQDIVGGLVHRRWPPFDPVLYRGRINQFTGLPAAEAYSGELVQVDVVGTGCVCIDTQVFLHTEYPWFEIQTAPNGKTIGEDFAFCVKAGEAGYKVYVDTSIEIGHLSTVVIDRKYSQAFAQLTGWKKGEAKADQ